MATAMKWSPSASLKNSPNRFSIVSPFVLVVSSVIAERLAWPAAVGASATGSTVMSILCSVIPPASSVMRMVNSSCPLKFESGLNVHSPEVELISAIPFCVLPSSLIEKIALFVKPSMSLADMDPLTVSSSRTLPERLLSLLIWLGSSIGLISILIDWFDESPWSSVMMIVNESSPCSFALGTYVHSPVFPSIVMLPFVA